MSLTGADLLRDGVYPFAGFASYFNDVYRVREHGRNLKSALDQLPPGTAYFVLQFLETDVLSFALIAKELQPPRPMDLPRR